MKKRTSFVLFIFILVAALAVGIVTYKKRKKELLSTTPVKTYPLPVQYAVSKRGSIFKEFAYVGKVESYSYATISTKVSGLVEKVFKQEGDSFKRGEILIKLDSSEIRASISSIQKEVAALRASIEGIEERIKSLEVIKENSKRELERLKLLWSKGGASKEAVEKAENAYQQVRSELSLLRSQLKSLKLKVEALENKEEAFRSRLPYTEIRAVKNGIVSHLYLHEGDMAMPGKPAMSVFYPEDGFKILVKVPPEEAEQIPIGEEVPVGKNSFAVVQKVYPAADRKTSLYVIELKVNSSRFRPEETVSVILKSRPIKGIVVPSEALLRMKNGVYVLQIRKNRVIPVKVKVLAVSGNKAVVEGLPPDVKVAVGRESKLLEVYRRRTVIPAEMINE